MHPRPAAATFLALLASVYLLSGCDDPESPAVVARAWRGVYDPSVSGVDAFSFSPESPPSGLQFVVLAVRSGPTPGIVQAEVALRNTRHAAVRAPAVVGFGDFAPAEVRSVFTVCDDPAADPGGSACFIDYRDTCGPEATLYTGERSQGLTWAFVNPGGQAFSFRIWLSDEAGPRPGEISGVVYADANRNGRRDPGETGVADAWVRLETGDAAFLRQANHVGRFAYQVAQPGRYRASLSNSAACPAGTPAERVVSIMRGPSGALTSSGRVDFGCGVGISDETATVDLPH